MNKKNNPEIETVATKLQEISAELEKVILGQKDIIKQILIAFLAGGHVLIEGVPGLGKTLLVKALAATFKGKFTRLQFTPDQMPADICGHMMFDTKKNEFVMKKGPIFTNLLLADEINRASAKTQSALLEVMQEYQVSIEGNTVKLDLPFMTLATQNPLDQEGTYPLPEAEIDRFLMKILIDYPDAADEINIVEAAIDHKLGNSLDVSKVQKILSATEIKKIQKAVTSIIVDRRIIKYAVELTTTTRDWPGLTIGAGPRGSLALIRCARSVALINGRDYVLPDDVKYIFLPAMRHRISLSPSIEIEGIKSDDILKNIIEEVKVPRI